MTPPRVVVVGDLITDVVAVLAGPIVTGSDAPAEIRFTGGGQAANTAAWLGALGVPVTLVGAVGDDGPGRDRVAELERGGVDCAVTRVPDVPPERSWCWPPPTNARWSPSGGRTCGCLRPRWTPPWLPRRTPATCTCPVTPCWDAGSRPAGLHALAAASRRGLTISVDAASAAPLQRVGAAAFLGWVRGIDLLLVNAAEARVLAGGLDPAAQGRVLSASARWVVVKRGAAGAVWVDRDAMVAVTPTRRMAVVDPTGAGDAFAAGLLSTWLTGASPEAVLQRAGDLGASAVGRVGARPPA